QHKGNCGGASALTGVYEECRKGRLDLQRFSAGKTVSSALPRSLAEPAKPTPPPSIGAGNGLHAGHSFGQVIVHSRLPHTIQTKRNVSQPDDQFEQEADRTAGQVPSAALRAQPMPGDDAALPAPASRADQTPAPGASPAEAATGTAAPEETASSGMIVEDDAQKVGPG